MSSDNNNFNWIQLKLNGIKSIGCMWECSSTLYQWTEILAERWRVRFSVGLAYEQVIWDFSVCSSSKEKNWCVVGKENQFKRRKVASSSARELQVTECKVQLSMSIRGDVNCDNDDDALTDSDNSLSCRLSLRPITEDVFLSGTTLAPPWRLIGMKTHLWQIWTVG